MKHKAWTVTAIAACGWLAATGAASAHPHVFVDASMEIRGDGNGHLASITNIWSMDELFSASVIPDFDKNANGKLDKNELAAVGEQVRHSIAEWSYYTSLSSAGTEIAMQPPSVLNTTFDAKTGRLLFTFTMKPKDTVDLTKKPVTFLIYDKTYFVAFDFPDEKRFKEKDLPKGCGKQFVVPTPDEAATHWMNAVANFGMNDQLPDDGVNFSQVLATRLELDCRSNRQSGASGAAASLTGGKNGSGPLPFSALSALRGSVQPAGQ